PKRLYTPLHFAISTNNAVATRVLLRHPQINLTLKNVDGQDPLIYSDKIRKNADATYLIQEKLSDQKLHVKGPTKLKRISADNWNTLEHFCYHVFTIYGIYCIYCIKKVNPGYLRRISDNKQRENVCIEFAKDSKWTPEHFCVTCIIRRPLRSKHCPVCHACVEKFDHHCTWLDACIGGRNHFYFIRVLTFGTCALFLWIKQGFSLLASQPSLSLWDILVVQFDPWFVYISILTIFNTFWVLFMTLFHLYNSIIYGVTINERLTRFRYDYFRDSSGKFKNPFKQSVVQNFLETFGLFRLLYMCNYKMIDWAKVYDLNDIQLSSNNKIS
ncbi:unnamed protein product, partial [Didymodactylos carnosus]